MRALGDKKMSKDTEKVNNIFIGLEDEHRSLTLHLSFKYVFSGICGTFKKNPSLVSPKLVSTNTKE